MNKKLTPERREYLNRNPLTKLMREHKITNLALAEKLKVHPITVSFWRQGMIFPSMKNMRKLAEFFKVGMLKLLDDMLKWKREALDR